MNRKITHSPWGAVQHSKELIPGITHVTTAGHGGIHLDMARMAKVPDCMRKTWAGSPWFEEDVDWCIPFCVFEAELAASGDQHVKDTIAKGTHRDTLRNWRPDDYEAFYGVTLAPGESHAKDEREWKRANADRWQCISASREGDAVRVTAALGGRATTPPFGWGETRDYLVSADEYAAGRQNAAGTFLIDPLRHVRVPQAVTA